jgi:hypothetical protein
MKKDDLARLHWLRKKREEKALRAVIACHGALLHAEHAAAEARAAAADHATRSQDQERSALGALMGKEVRTNGLLSVQANLDAAADDQQRLNAAERQAAEERDARGSELERARAVFHRHYRDAEKLGQVVGKRNTELARKQLALSEASSDELYVDSNTEARFSATAFKE